VVLELRGSISYHHSKLLKNSFNVLFGSQQNKIVIDLTKVTFLAHQVLVVFLSALEKARHLRGNIIICGANKGIEILFEKAKMDQAFSIVEDRPTALRSI